MKPQVQFHLEIQMLNTIQLDMKTIIYPVKDPTNAKLT